jgi:hypothetical protein
MYQGRHWILLFMVLGPSRRAVGGAAMSHAKPVDSEQNLERRFPRRFLLSAGAAVAALGVTEAVAPGASAATASTAWVLGGNTSVATNGTNFLGTKNKAPLIFKTTATTQPVERMRITPSGTVGINAPVPTAMLDVRGGGVTIHAVNTNASGAAAGLLASATQGSGVKTASTDGSGVYATSTNGAAIKATSTNGIGLVANGGPGAFGLTTVAGYCGASGTGGTYGGIFYGTGSSAYGSFSSGTALGAYGSGATYGLYGSGGTGVYGTGVSYGVNGVASDPNGSAVWGSGGQYGVLGNNGRTAGVRGDSGYVGVWGQAPTYGVFGMATNSGTAQTYGVFGQASNAASFAVFAQGNAHVNGTLSKVAGSFKIDHPLDPEAKWLSHSFVESPDMMNVYNGNVVLDQDGTATVRLPDYFTALNRDFRYQLTPIGAHAPVYIASKVADNAFTIAGGTAGLEVSWQVTGIRQDAYAAEHPIVVETEKSAADRGTRQFVPAGSKARAMRAHPTAGDDPIPKDSPAFAIQVPRAQPVD